MRFLSFIGPFLMILAGCGGDESAYSPQKSRIFGNWDCEVMSFSLSATAYTNASETPVKTVERLSANDYGVELADGYRFALMDVSDSTLTWHSVQSGDSFDCRRS